MFDFDILDSKTLLGESGFYLHKTNEIVFLDLIKTSIIFYSIDSKRLIKLHLKLKKPLGNVYPLNDDNFIISSFEGMHIYNRKKNSLKYFNDIRKINELDNLSYNDGTISKNKLWIGLSHIKESKNLGYFGYLQNKNFVTIDTGFKVSNGPAIDESKGSVLFRLIKLLHLSV